MKIEKRRKNLIPPLINIEEYNAEETTEKPYTEATSNKQNMDNEKIFSTGIKWKMKNQGLQQPE